MDRNSTIATPLGRLAYRTRTVSGTQPVVFLHGLFLDSDLWAPYDTDLTARTHLYVDLPAHGDSEDVGRPWVQEECVELMTVLDELGIEKCTVIGHSWGAITALQAATGNPSRFSSLGLFNMPFERPSRLEMAAIRLQKILALFPKFYADRVARAIYTKDFLASHRQLSEKMQDALAKRPYLDIVRMIDAVMLNAPDLMPLIRSLPVPAMAVVGESDHVKEPPGLPTITVPGKHVSPMQAPEKSRSAIMKVIALSGSGPQNDA